MTRSEWGVAVAIVAVTALIVCGVYENAVERQRMISLGFREVCHQQCAPTTWQSYGKDTPMFPVTTTYPCDCEWVR